MSLVDIASAYGMAVNITACDTQVYYAHMHQGSGVEAQAALDAHDATCDAHLEE